MASNSRFVICIGSFFVTAIAYLIALIMDDKLSSWDALSEILSPIRLSGLLFGITFFILALILYILSGNFVQYEEHIGLGLFFIILWIICSFGLVFGDLIWILVDSGSSITITLDIILDAFFILLALGLIPTLAVSLSVSNK